jgi:tetratricopeptide (TPR) repeat protein
VSEQHNGPFGSALTAADKREWEGLLQTSERRVMESPEDEAAWFNMGLAYNRVGRHQEAIEALNQAVFLRPDDANAWKELGDACHCSPGRHQEAARAYERAVHIKPDDAVAWNNLGVVYDHLARYEEAVKAYQQALRIKRDEAVVWNNLGIVYDRLGRYAEAAEAYRQALRIKPDYDDARKNLESTSEHLAHSQAPTEPCPPAVHPNQDFPTNYASFWDRLGAYLIDILIRVALILFFIAVATKEQASALAVISAWLYYSLFESSSWQATPGKKVLGLIVTDLYGQPISFGRATARFFGRLLSGLTLGVGFIMAGFTEKKQALHDELARCLVLRPADRKVWDPRIHDREKISPSGVFRRYVIKPGYITVLVAVLLAVGVLAFVVIRRQQPPGEAGTRIFEQASPSVVVVLAADVAGRTVSEGSGVVIGPGEVVTNHHVVEAGTTVKVRAGKQEFPAVVRYPDPGHDLCLLAVTGLAAPAATLASARALKVGEKVFAIGAPEGLALTMSEGIVSSLPTLDNDVVIQTTAPISPGSSGGGLFDAQGRLVGITSYYLKKGQNLNFALPADWIAVLVAHAKQGERRQDSAVSDRSGWLASARRAAEERDWEGLLRIAQARLKEAPDDELAWFWLGFAYYHLGRYQDEVKAYQEALRIKPDDADAWYALGATYGHLGRYQDEVKACQEALRIKPDNAITWNNLGVVYGHLGRYQDEVKAYQEALRIKPDDADAWYALGATYDHLGRHQDAVEAYQQALRVKPR